MILCIKRLVALKRADVFFFKLSAFSTNTTCQLNIFRHDGHSLGMNSAEISVFE